MTPEDVCHELFKAVANADHDCFLQCHAPEAMHASSGGPFANEWEHARMRHWKYGAQYLLKNKEAVDSCTVEMLYDIKASGTIPGRPAGTRLEGGRVLHVRLRRVEGLWRVSRIGAVNDMHQSAKGS